MKQPTRLSLTSGILVLALSAWGNAQDSRPSDDAAAARRAIDEGVTFLLGKQNPDGSFGGTRNATFTSSFGNPATYRCWQVGTTGLVIRSLWQSTSRPEAKAAAARALSWLCKNANLVRPADWDVDNVWGLIYGLDALGAVLSSGELTDAALEKECRAAAAHMVRLLEKYQTHLGGWGYYADDVSAWRPGWATSFTTAAGILALLEARAAGIEVPEKLLRTATYAVEKSRLPTGAYSYDVSPTPRHPYLESIDQIKGSLGRIQIGNLALFRAGKPKITRETLAEGLEHFFEHHKFLDVARNKPIPHEAYYANAAYFYLFGHYYAARVMDEVPKDVRARHIQRLRAEVLKCFQKDGSAWDFWIADNTKCYGTAFGVLALSHLVTPEGP